MRKQIVTVALALVGLTAVFLAHVQNPEQSTVIGRAFVNSLHAPGFGVVAILTLIWLRRRLSARSAYIVAAVLTIAIGTISEAIQVASPRNADFGDLLNDIIGVAAFLCLSSVFDPAFRRSRKPACTVLVSMTASALLTIALYPTIWYSYAAIAQRVSAPSILSFDKKWEHMIWQVASAGGLELMAAPPMWPLSGKLGRLSLAISDSPALTIQPFRDWSGYDNFSFLAASADGASHSVVIRVNDVKHTHSYDDRFNRLLNITVEPQRFHISLEEIRQSPASRTMDLSAVNDIILFIRDERFEGTIFVDDFRIE